MMMEIQQKKKLIRLPTKFIGPKMFFSAQAKKKLDEISNQGFNNFSSMYG